MASLSQHGRPVDDVVIDDYLDALAASVADVNRQRSDDRSTNYATLQ